jgi:hypothetical protein
MARPLNVIAKEYAGGIRDLFPTGPAVGAERAGAFVGRDAMATQIPTLALLSEEFNAALAVEMQKTSEAERDEATLRALAKSRADLELGTLLLDTDRTEELKAGALTGTARGASGGDLLDAAKAMESPSVAGRMVRGARAVSSVDDAKDALRQAVRSGFAQISEHAAKTGRQAISGVAAQGIANLADIAGRLGLAAAEVIGVGDTVKWLVRWARSFLARAYEAIISVFGQGMVQAAAKRLAEWFNHLIGDGFQAFVDQNIYQVPTVTNELNAKIEKSAAAADKLSEAKDYVDSLGRAFQEHTRLCGQLLGALDGYAGYITAIFNEFRLAVAVVYAAIGGYVLLDGADYDDCAWLPFDRVKGIRLTVEAAV